MKKCPRCQTAKLATEFHVATKRLDGLGAYCKPCALERQKIWRANNRERHRAYTQQWTAGNRDRYLSGKRARYRERKASYRVAVIEWKKRNPEALRDYFHRRKAALKKVGGSHTRAQIAALAAAQGYLCMACRCDISKRWDRDHIVPISKGGSNDISNIQLLCPPCNYEKRAKDWTVFLEQRAG